MDPASASASVPIVKAQWVCPSQFKVHSLSLRKVTFRAGWEILTVSASCCFYTWIYSRTQSVFTEPLNVSGALQGTQHRSEGAGQISGTLISDLSGPDPERMGLCLRGSLKGAPQTEPMCSPTRLLLWPRTCGYTSLSCCYHFGEMR